MIWEDDYAYVFGHYMGNWNDFYVARYFYRRNHPATGFVIVTGKLTRAEAQAHAVTLNALESIAARATRVSSEVGLGHIFWSDQTTHELNH